MLLMRYATCQGGLAVWVPHSDWRRAGLIACQAVLCSAVLWCCKQRDAPGATDELPATQRLATWSSCRSTRVIVMMSVLVKVRLSMQGLVMHGSAAGLDGSR